MAFNPSATILGVEADLSGNQLKINVTYSASNPDAMWNTLIVIVREDTGEVFCKTHGMISRDDDHIVEPLIIGAIPSQEITINVSILGHDDYWSAPPTYCS